MEISIRHMEISDAPSVTELSGQLGYYNTIDETELRIGEMLQYNYSCLFVAVCNGQVTGWVHGCLVTRLESGSFAEIGGIVVNQSFRQQGIGKLLVEAVATWANEKGITKLRVRCNTNRPASHRFYQNLGFTLNKEQKVFDKGL